jgi:leucyl aminopeptidase
VIAAVGLGPVPEDGNTPATRCAGPPPRRPGSWPGSAKVALALPAPTSLRDTDEALRAIAEGALLGTYRFSGYKTKPQPGRRDPVKAVSLHVTDAGRQGRQGRGEAGGGVAARSARTRDWINTAPNELRPPRSPPRWPGGRRRRPRRSSCWTRRR